MGTGVRVLVGRGKGWHLRTHGLPLPIPTPTWSWTVKAGPNAGKSFSIPTVPTTCGKDSPGAVQWLVSTFHAFKAILTPMALNAKTRQVLPAYVKLFQNNMLVHLVQQSHSQVSPPPAPKSRVPPGPPPPPSAPRAEIAALRSELVALRAELEEFKKLFESSSSEGSSPLPPASETREFQGSTPRCPGPNPHPYLHNTRTCTPKGAGHSHGCRGANPSWVYPRVGHFCPHSYSTVHRGHYITIYYT